MDLKLFGKKIELSLVISIVTLMIVLFTTYSCCHTQNVIESMTNNKKLKKKSKKGGLKEGHETIYNSQAKMPGTVVNVATPTPVVNPHVVPQHTHAPTPQPTQPLSLNINLNKKKKMKKEVLQLLKQVKQMLLQPEIKQQSQLRDFLI